MEAPKVGLTVARMEGQRVDRMEGRREAPKVDRMEAPKVDRRVDLPEEKMKAKPGA